MDPDVNLYDIAGLGLLAINKGARVTTLIDKQNISDLKLRPQNGWP